MSDRSVTAATVVGAGLAATGVAHFVVPQAFAGITAQAFPDDTDTWYVAAEVAAGLARLEESGVDEVIVSVGGKDRDAVEQQLTALAS